MKYKIFAAVLLGVLVVGLSGSTLADSKSKKASLNQLVSLLPASDGVVTFDVQRFFGDVLPRVLSSNQTLLGKVTGHLEEFRGKTGIDVRQFDEVAVGVSTRQIADKKFDIDPVVIARGQMTSGSLIGAAKLASNGKYREERIGEKAMYIFDGEKVAKGTAQSAKVVGKMTEVAVAALDERTLAFGDVARVRLALEGKTRVGADLTALLARNPVAVAAFAAKMPSGLKSFVPLENDELGKNIDSIQYVYGNADVVSGFASLHLAARTAQNAQAASLLQTLEGLQMIGKAFLGGSKGADKQVYARLIENARFSAKANEVTVDLQVPQSDIDVLVGLVK